MVQKQTEEQTGQLCSYWTMGNSARLGLFYHIVLRNWEVRWAAFFCPDTWGDLAKDTENLLQEIRKLRLLSCLHICTQEADFHRAEIRRTEASLGYTREIPQKHGTYRVRSKIHLICSFSPRAAGMPGESNASIQQHFPSVSSQLWPSSTSDCIYCSGALHGFFFFNWFV